MFEAWGHMVYRRRRLVLVIAALGVIFAAVWGTGVFGSLQSAGGCGAAGSQSQQEANLAASTFGRDAGDVVVLYSSPAQTVTSPAFRSAVTGALAALPRSRVASYFVLPSPPPAPPPPPALPRRGGGGARPRPPLGGGGPPPHTRPQNPP